MEFLVSDTGRFIELLMRWTHFLAGVVWIGHLYYFNFVQGTFFSEIDAQTKNVAITKLVPRALWWFRWGAMFTFLSGLYMLAVRGHLGGFQIYTSAWGISILIGALLATIMFLNVWLVIWPNQKIVIQNATQVLAGGQPLPQAAACAAKAGLASRTNTLFSIPMLLFMGMATHFGYSVTATSLWPLWIVVFLLVGGLEVNALKGKMGPLTTVKGVIACGFILTLVLGLVVRFLS